MTIPLPQPSGPPSAPPLTLPNVVNARIPALDGLRGAAILFVLLYHIQGGIPGASSNHPGWAGVDLFFVVSGFLITGILWESRREPRYYSVFYARRTLRIFPLYYASLLGLFVIVPAVLHLLHRAETAESVLMPSTQLFAWTYTLNWLVGLKTFHAVSLYIQHFWSLSVEEQFYLCWPAIVRRLGARALVVLCGGLVLLAPALRIFFHAQGMPEAAYAWTVCRCDGLAIGAAIAIAARNLRAWTVLSRVAPRVAALSLLAFVALAGFRHGAGRIDPWIGTLGVSLISVFFGSALVLVLNAGSSGLLSRTLRGGPLAFFGKYSYGMYVFHLPIGATLAWKQALYRRLADSPLGSLGATLVYFAIAIGLTTACALLSWRLLEKPFLSLKDPLARWLRRSHDRKRPAPLASEPVT